MWSINKLDAKQKQTKLKKTVNDNPSFKLEYLVNELNKQKVGPCLVVISQTISLINKDVQTHATMDWVSFNKSNFVIVSQFLSDYAHQEYYRITCQYFSTSRNNELDWIFFLILVEWLAIDFNH